MTFHSNITPTSELPQPAGRQRGVRVRRFGLAGIGLLLALLASSLFAEDKAEPATQPDPAAKAPAEPAPKASEEKKETAPPSTTTDANAPGYGNRTAPESTLPSKLKSKAPAITADMLPCKVQIRVGFGTDPLLGPQDRQDFLTALEEHASRFIGDMWQVAIAAEPRLSPGGAFLLGHLTPETLQLHYQPAGVDKLYLLTVETVAGGSGYLLTGREWDVATRQLSPVRQRTVYVRDVLGSEAMQLVHELHRPVVHIERVGKTENRLRALAGDIIPPDPTWLPLRAGAIFEGYTRFLDKNKVVKSILPVPWSYITVGKIERGIAACTIVSGLQSPFKGKQRMMEQVGLEIRRYYDASDLILMTRGLNNARPQTGLEVEILADTKPKIVDKKPQFDVLHRYLSNRLGVVRIPAEIPAGTEKVWIVVRSSMVPLARLPYIPGLHKSDQLQLPDDSLRLRVEGELTLLQADIVDTVARREVMRATAKAQKKTGNVPRLDELIAEFDTLLTGEQFSAKLSALRESSTAQAKKNKDRVAETRIVKLCAETAEMIASHLNADKVHIVRDELVDIRTTIADDNKVKKQMQDFQNADDSRSRRNQKKAGDGKKSP